MSIYLLMLSVKGGWKVHSVHTDITIATTWALCKQHDGEETQIVLLEQDEANTIADLLQVSEASSRKGVV